jgi:hypothetical protein
MNRLWALWFALLCIALPYAAPAAAHGEGCHTGAAHAAAHHHDAAGANGMHRSAGHAAPSHCLQHCAAGSCAAASLPPPLVFLNGSTAVGGDVLQQIPQPFPSSLFRPPIFAAA